MPFIYVYGRKAGIGRGSVGIGRSRQVGTDRNKSGLGLHKSRLIVTSRC